MCEWKWVLWVPTSQHTDSCCCLLGCSLPCYDLSIFLMLNAVPVRVSGQYLPLFCDVNWWIYWVTHCLIFLSWSWKITERYLNYVTCYAFLLLLQWVLPSSLHRSHSQPESRPRLSLLRGISEKAAKFATIHRFHGLSQCQRSFKKFKFAFCLLVVCSLTEVFRSFLGSWKT